MEPTATAERPLASQQGIIDGVLAALESRFGPVVAQVEQESADPIMASLRQHIEAHGVPESGELLRREENGSWARASLSDHVEQQVEARMAMGGLLTAVETPLNGVFPGINVPFGSILVGGTTGIVLGELIDGLVAPLNDAGNVNPANVAVKIGVMVGVGALGKHLMTKTGVIVAVGVLGAQLFADILPLDKVVDWFKGLLPSKNGAAQGNVLSQADRVVHNYQVRQPPPIVPASADVLSGIW